MALSTLLISVPEAEPYVKDLRRRYDPAGQQQLPAHITLLVPFMAWQSMTADDLAKISGIFTAAVPFDCVLRRVARFPQTAYLVPEPAEPFVELTEALVARFPAYPPYGEAFPDITPHLTVADKSAESAHIAAAEILARMTERGPIYTRCDHVDLYEKSDESWRKVYSFMFGSGTQGGFEYDRKLRNL